MPPTAAGPAGPAPSNCNSRDHHATLSSCEDEHPRIRGRGAPAPVSAPATIVVDTPGLEALVGEVAAEDSYGFDTEFHTERTYVPDLALIQIAWAGKTALVDPLAVDPAPLARVFGGPGVAVVHAASQDLDVLMAACGVIPAVV